VEPSTTPPPIQLYQIEKIILQTQTLTKETSNKTKKKQAQQQKHNKH
jgi:hypothetical protein